MTRAQFLEALFRRLEELGDERAQEHLVFYAEMLADRMDEGMTEEEAVASMEDVDVIADRILLEELRTAEQARQVSRRRWTVLAAGLGAVLSVIIVFLLISYSGSVRMGGAYAEVVPEPMPPSTAYESFGEGALWLDPTGIREIGIEWYSGGVNVLLWEEAMICIYEENADGSADWQRFEVEEEDGVLEIRGKLGGFSGADGQLNVLLPGALAADALEELAIWTTSAGISVQEITAESVMLETTSGDCRVVGTCGELAVFTVSGSAVLEGSFREVDYDSTSGSLTLLADSGLRALEADTISGAVEVALPAGMQPDVSFSTVSGALKSGGFPLNGSDCSIRVDTVSGNLRLRAQ